MKHKFKNTTQIYSNQQLDTVSIVKRIKTGGRKKNVPNKKTALINAILDHFIDSGKEKFLFELNTLKGEKYTNTIIGLVKIINYRDNTVIQANSLLTEILNNKK